MLRSGELDDADKATLGRDRQAAILLNQSQKTAVVFAYCWKYTDLRGSTHKSTYTSFGTSDQMNFLLGGPVALTSRAGMLHPSARILVAQDVAWNSANDANDFAIGHSAGGSARHKSRGSPAKIDLCLDLVVLEDGICFGPNELELFELFRQDLDRQRCTADENCRCDAERRIGKRCPRTSPPIYFPQANCPSLGEFSALRASYDNVRHICSSSLGTL